MRKIREKKNNTGQAKLMFEINKWQIIIIIDEKKQKKKKQKAKQLKFS